MIIEHEPIHDLESPGIKPVTVAPKRSTKVDNILRPEVNVNRGDLVVFWSIRLEEVSDLLQAERVNTMSSSRKEGRVVQSSIGKDILALNNLTIIFIIQVLMDMIVNKNLARVVCWRQTPTKLKDEEKHKL